MTHAWHDIPGQNPLAYGIWAALLIPVAVGLAALIAVLVDRLIRERRQERRTRP